MLADYEQEPQGDPPLWTEWSTPVLKVPVIQANANVALLAASQEDSTFDYWLRVSTLEAWTSNLASGDLADYHRHVLAGKTLTAQC